MGPSTGHYCIFPRGGTGRDGRIASDSDESKFWNPIGFLSESINYTKIDNFTHNLSDNITEMTFGVGLLNKVKINNLFSLIFGLTTVNTPEHILNEKGNIETIDRNGLMMPAFSLLIHPL